MAAAWFEWYKSTEPVVMLLSIPLFGPLAERIDRFLTFRYMAFAISVDDVPDRIDEEGFSDHLREIASRRQ